MKDKRPQILLTNDDGINSPGLWAAAEALSEIGYVWVVAPLEQSTSMGRSMPPTAAGTITPQELEVNGKYWTVYAVDSTPALAVQHGILEIIKAEPDLVVSGINYGLNLGTGITISGTVGAAIEAASHDIPALAVSLETGKEFHLTYSTDINFQTAAYFTAYFGLHLLNHQFPPQVQLLKVDLPADACPDTPWELTRLSPVRYYLPQAPQQRDWSRPTTIDYQAQGDINLFPPDSDVYTVLEKKHISVTPLTLDMTSQVDFDSLDKQIRKVSGS